jgi:hypothetical protein
MPIPQVNDRIKEAPVVMLRAVFAGIGQILLTADKVRARAAEQVWTSEHAPAGLPADRRPSEPPRNGTTRTEPAVADHPAVREAPASQGPVTAETAPATKPTPAAKAPPAAKTTLAPRTVPAPRAAKAEPATEAPPLPGYDDLSLASLRARLRVLDAATIQAMLAYERAHARREPVVTMLERRLAKISAG